MKIVVVILVFYSTFNIFSQSAYRRGTTRTDIIFILPQGFGIPLLNAKGSSGINNNISNINFVNPASIGEFPNYNFAFSYQFQSSISEAYVYYIGTSRIYNFLPQSAGGVFHYNNFSFGIGLGQKYNGTFDIGPIPITTAQNPEGTGQFFVPEFERVLHNYSLVASYSFKELFSENSDLSLGFKYNLNRFYAYESIQDVYAEASILGSNYEFGAVYKFNYDKDKNIHIGISYETNTEFRDVIIYKSDNSTHIPGSDTTIYNLESQPFIIEVKVPPEIHLDFGFRPAANLKVFGSIVDIFWKNVSENLQNQIQLSSSAVYSFNPTVAASIGFYYTDRQYIEDYYRVNGKMHAFFLTAGLSLNFNIFNLDLAIADSHLQSGDYWEQTIGKITLGIQL